MGEGSPTGGPTLDGRNPAPPNKPWGDASPVNTNKHWFAMISKCCRISSTHSSKSNDLHQYKNANAWAGACMGPSQT